MIDAKRLAEIRARAECATAGPWWWDEDRREVRSVNAVDEWGHRYDRDESSGPIVETDMGHYPPYRVDREFIAHARQDVPDLLAEVERLRNLVAAVEWRGHDCYEMCPWCGADKRCGDGHYGGCAFVAAMGGE